MLLVWLKMRAVFVDCGVKWDPFRICARVDFDAFCSRLVIGAAACLLQTAMTDVLYLTEYQRWADFPIVLLSGLFPDTLITLSSSVIFNLYRFCCKLGVRGFTHILNRRIVSCSLFAKDLQCGPSRMVD